MIASGMKCISQTKENIAISPTAHVADNVIMAQVLQNIFLYFCKISKYHAYTAIRYILPTKHMKHCIYGGLRHKNCSSMPLSSHILERCQVIHPCRLNKKIASCSFDGNREGRIKYNQNY
jgi:hypothetical protein